MTKKQMINKIDEMIDQTKTGVLTMVTKNGQSHMRWMVPAIIKDRLDSIFTVATPKASFLSPDAYEEGVHWMLQNKNLDEVVHIRGKINVLDHPSIKMEIIEAIGPNLEMFWKINYTDTEFVVLETVIETAVYYKPLKGTEKVVFS